MSSTLSCGTCSKNFYDPRLLPCLHVFCKSCLDPLYTKDEEEDIGKLTCPTCNKTNVCPPPGELPRHIKIDRESIHITPAVVKEEEEEIGDMKCSSCDEENQAEAFCKECAAPICSECNHSHKRLKSTRSHTILPLTDLQKPPPVVDSLNNTKQMVTCIHHPDETIKYYCSTCSCLVCSECLFNHKEHDSARTDNAEVLEKEKGELESVLPKLTEAITPITKAIEKISNISERVQANKERAREEINGAFAQIVEAVQTRQNELLQEVDNSAVAKCGMLDKQKGGLEKVLGSLQLALDAGTAAVNEYSGVEILAVKGSILNAANEILDEAQGTSLRPVDNSNLGLAIDNKPMIELVSSLGTIVMGHPFPFTCGLVGINPKLPIGVAKGTDCIVILQSKDERGDPLTEGMAKVTAKVFTTSGSEVCQCDVQDQENGSYQISFNAANEGNYLLRISVEDKVIGDGDQVVQVRDYTAIQNPVTSASIQGSPAYVDIGPDNQQYITLNGGSIEVYNKAKKVKDIHLSKLGNKPLRGIAVDKKEKVLFVATAGTHQIIKADLSGNVVASVGTKGNSKLEFYYPMGLCLTNEGLLLVAEDTNKRVQVLNSDLSFVRLIPCMSNVYGVSVDGEGNIHAAVTDRVEVFNIDGEKISEYGQGVLSRAGDVAFLSSYCSSKSPYSFVADHISEGKVHMFNWSENALVHSFPMGRRPLGLAVDQEGGLIVGDWNEKKVHRF